MEKGIKAKGDELIQKFSSYTDVAGDSATHTEAYAIKIKFATQCSIIAVEEIIKEYTVRFPTPREQPYVDMKREHWNEVLNYLKSKL